MEKSTRTIDEQRNYNMSRIRSTDTSIESCLRKALWRDGIRYKKNYKILPGKPDIVITKHKIAIFCDGEYWHGKDWEIKKAKIHSNKEYWISKIERNMRRDIETNRLLRNMGWEVLRFWGNDIGKNVGACVESVKDMITQTIIDAYDEL